MRLAPQILQPSSDYLFGMGRLKTFFTSGVFVVPNGVYRIRVSVLGAGSGAHCTVSNASSNWPNFGGTGGGFAGKIIEVQPGDVFIVTVGVGGLGRCQTMATKRQAAQSGSSSSFGTILTATGGIAPADGTTLTNATPGVPGNGFGGDVNYPGGLGGFITGLVGAAPYYAFGGGAAGSWYGPGGNGGGIKDLNNSKISARLIALATGGGAAGEGHGVSITGDSTKFDANINVVTGGGGVCGDSVVADYPYFTALNGTNGNIFTFASEDSTVVPPIPFMLTLIHPLYGSGQTASLSGYRYLPTKNAARGAGTCGSISLNNNISASAPNALVIGGGGGVVNLSTDDGCPASGGVGGFGGGGGAACGTSGLNTYVYGGRGGNGLVCVEY